MSTFFVILNMVKNMTKKLTYILIFLIIITISYVVYVKFDVITEYVKDYIYNIGKENIDIPVGVSEYRRDYDYSTFTMTADYEPNNVEEIKNLFFTILNNGWNDFTFYCPREYESCTEDVKNVTNDDEFVTLMNNYVSPYNSFINFNTLISGDKTIYITVDKLYNESDIINSNKKIDEIINEIDTSNKVNAIKEFHNKIIQITKYNKSYIEGIYASSSNKATGVFIDGSAVCSGYADAMALLLDKIDIPNFKVSSENHIWNVVYINNKWNHIDVTWDDDENNNYNRTNFFLISTNELLNIDTSEHTFNIDLYKELK